LHFLGEAYSHRLFKECSVTRIIPIITELILFIIHINVIIVIIDNTVVIYVTVLLFLPPVLHLI